MNRLPRQGEVTSHPSHLSRSAPARAIPPAVVAYVHTVLRFSFLLSSEYQFFTNEHVTFLESATAKLPRRAPDV